MLTATGREITVVGYRPAGSTAHTDDTRLRRENDRLRRDLRRERRRRMAAYEQTLRAEAAQKRWWREHRLHLLGVLLAWHAIEVFAVCSLVCWVCYMLSI